MVPIFIITKDRIDVLQQSIKSYFRNIATPIELVIHDNGSSYPPMLEILDSFEDQGVPVYRSKHIKRANDLTCVSNTISSHMRTSKSPYYIVTDPDIALDNVQSDILEYYATILKEFKVDVVGPMLRIDDIPEYYPFRDIAIKSHTLQFWGKKSLTWEYEGILYQYLPAPIDTSFGMYRRTFKFKRLNMGIRTFDPYAAKHLDWYLNPNALTSDQEYYARSASEHISHWSKFDCTPTPPMA